ncbi:tetratricopeptide repeat protein [Psychrobacter aestuarii]|uniref:Tetratricopeptide repeat protein n=1 Tax=Psychrobacter aestuarii TaxID=556327 RepID=A0ABP3FNX7_9GAMM|nr:tetratricopeptide repeat protein [Psychrobacter aestuarii]
MTPAHPLSISTAVPRYHWMLGAVLGSLWLSACQSPQSAMTSAAPKPATIPAHSITVNHSPTDESRFESKPDVPTADMSRHQATRANPSTAQGDDAPYDTRYADPNIEAVEPPNRPAPTVIIEPEVIIIPIPQEPIIVPPPRPPSHQELLEQARQHSARPAARSSSSNDNLPAFRNLMQVGVEQLSRGELTAAEGNFTRAQRLVPQSSAVYFYLSQVALKKNQPHKAEAMARRGLSVSEDAVRRRALWQLILRAGQQQNNARVIQEAQQALR